MRAAAIAAFGDVDVPNFGEVPTPSPKSGHLLSPEQKTLVKETWRKVAPMADTAARLFYDRLFEIDATTRPLFKTTNPAERAGSSSRL
jgi:hypothetical protein